MANVEQIGVDCAAELLSVEHDLARLKEAVRRHLESSDDDVGRLTTDVRALIYLRDPYDALMDQHLNLGLQDDCAVIRSAARSLVSDQMVKAAS